jgi:hypothetical protein
MKVEREGNVTRMSEIDLVPLIEIEELGECDSVRVTLEFGVFRVSAELRAEDAKRIGHELVEAAFRLTATPAPAR